MTIKKDAIFIADSHYNSERTSLFDILTQIDTEQIKTTQLFLMGDMFDFLAGEIEYFKVVNDDVINIINKLSDKIEIIYFEGNHDFNLKNIFSKIYIIPRKNQPIQLTQKGKKISLAHGDIFTPKEYDIFSLIFRNHYFLRFLNCIDKNNWLSKIFEKKQKAKKLCHKQDNYDDFIEKRINEYNVDLVVEGHFHQGYQDDKYINLPSLACDDRYTIYQDNKFSFKTL